MNIVIPMAGRGERFRNNGFETPKPIIDVNGKPMIQAAIESLDLNGQYIFIVYDYENEEFNIKIKEAINRSCENPKIIKINYTTQGPASSALLAKELINNKDQLVITNCDQIMSWNSSEFIQKINNKDKLDGLVVTYSNTTPKNSYVRLNSLGLATKLAEKRVISNYSLNGIHYWKNGSEFISSAEEMIKDNNRVNNEFYISETYNYLIKNRKRVGIYHIPANQHNSVGVPEDLRRYIENIQAK